MASAEHMQFCILTQTDNHTSIPPLSFYRLDALLLPPNQQRQNIEGKILYKTVLINDNPNTNLTLLITL